MKPIICALSVSTETPAVSGSHMIRTLEAFAYASERFAAKGRGQYSGLRGIEPVAAARYAVHAETVRWTKVIKDAGIKIST
jgi:hypothetical protein